MHLRSTVHWSTYTVICEFEGREISPLGVKCARISITTRFVLALANINVVLPLTTLQLSQLTVLIRYMGIITGMEISDADCTTFPLPQFCSRTDT